MKKTAKFRKVSHVLVHRGANSPLVGWLHVGSTRFACALGRSGIATLKNEGDGRTPRGTWPLRRVFYRADRLRRPQSLRATRKIQPTDAWCDDRASRHYNRLIVLAQGTTEESLARNNHLYDIIVELGFNDAPVRRGRGSAIFWHGARPGLSPTAGCVAIRIEDFAKILPRLARDAVMVIR